MRKVKVRPKARLVRFLLSPVGKGLLILLVFGLITGLGTFTYFYVHYSHIIDQKLKGGPFTNTAKIYAMPRTVAVGERLAPAELLATLRRAGYSEARGNRTGWHHQRAGAIEIFPGPDALQPEAGVIKFKEDRVTGIVSAQDHTARTEFQLEPELVTNLSDKNREKRRLVRFEDIPKILIHAVISAEDKRFFQHAGFDPLRILKAAYVDIREGYKKEGASTLSMQLARSFWLDTSKRWTRKAAEVMITLQLEQRLTKQEIFEYYANQIDLGRRGSFQIRGFGQAAQAYFGKDMRQLTLPEAALLAGIIQLPSYYNPLRHAQRAKERRNVVLGLMRQNGYIGDREYALACEAPLNLAPGGIESADAPYFVDLVNDELQTHFQDHDFQGSSYRIYTTIDMNLQRAAAEAVRIGMPNVDELLRKQRRHRNAEFPDAQVALVALDPHTGEVRALIGGRNYGVSQLNRVLAKRQPGSVFKPWVYATAINTAVAGGPTVFTPLSRILDEPTTFWFDEKPYEPGNFKKEYHGEVTLRTALAKSINIPTVKVAEAVGYDKVVELASAAGMNLDIKPTPAVALGAYEVMPIEIAGAYTVFANGGAWVKPNWISQIRAADNSVIYTFKPEIRPVLDPRVAYMMVNLLEEVMRSGTAAGVRGRGFLVPAAGKTGTSHDAWFAGFTSELLCVVWVGFDDNRELNLEGAKAAAPIWTEFMKRALEYKEYRNTRPFEAPDGIVTVQIDPLSGQPATGACPQTKLEVFIAGTEPLGQSCRLHGGGQPGVTHVAGWEQTAPPPSSAPAAETLVASAARPAPPPARQPAREESRTPAAPKQNEPREKKGFLRRLLGIFR